MGFTSGTDLVKPFFQKMSLRAALSIAGHPRFAVDISGILHRKLSRFASYVVTDNWQEFDAAVEAECAALAVALQGVTPVFVFDGRRVAAKRANGSRKQDRQKASEELQKLRATQEALKAERLELLGRGGGAVGTSACGSVSGSQASPSNNTRLDQLRDELKNASEGIAGAEKVVAAGLNIVAAERAILVCRRRNFDYIVAPGEAEHQMRTMQAAGDIGVVCGFDTDFFAMGCDSIVYGQTLTREIQYVDWTHADARVQQHADIVFTSGPNSVAYDAALTRAMRIFTVKLVVQLSALFLRNDYGACGIGLKTLSEAWGKMADSGITEPTVPLLTGHICSLRKCSQLSVIMLTAERAAFMYYCQVAVTERESQQCCLTEEELPSFAQGCIAQLLKPRVRARAHTSRQLRVYDVQRKEDEDVLNQRNFFRELSPQQLRSWTRGDYHVDVATPQALRKSDIPAVNDIPSTMTEALTADKVDAYLNNQSLAALKALAMVMDIPVSGLSLHDLRRRLSVVINLLNTCMPVDTLDAALDPERRHVTAINKAKLEISAEMRRAFKAAPHRASLKEADGHARVFKCDEETLLAWQEMAPHPYIGASKRAREGRNRVTEFIELAVDARGDIGFIHIRIQASMPVNYFYDVIVKVALEPVSHADMCTGRTIVHVLDVCCLLAEGVVSEDGVTTKVPGTQRAAGIVNDHRYCYGGKFCMHATAALYAIHFATVPSTTDTPGYWVKPGQTLSRSLAAVVGLPIFNFIINEATTAADAAYFNPLSAEQCEDVCKGVGPGGDPVYRNALIGLLKVVSEETGATSFRMDPILHGPDHGDTPVVYGNSAIPRDYPKAAGAASDTVTNDVYGDSANFGSDGAGAAMDTTPDVIAATPDVMAPELGSASAASPGEREPDLKRSKQAGGVAVAGDAAEERPKRYDRRDGPKTRAVAPKYATRVVRKCACPAACIIDSDVDGPCSVRIPREARERWLTNLGCSKADTERKSAMRELFVHPFHFRAADFEFSERRKTWNLVATPEFHTPRPETKPLRAEALAESRARNNAFRRTCVCALEGCADTLDDNNSVSLCIHARNKWFVDERELKILRRQQPPEETKLLQHHIGRRSFRVALTHFEAGDIEWVDQKPRRRRGARASIMREAVESRRTTPEDRREKGRGRQHLAALGIPAFPEDDFNQRLGQSLLELEKERCPESACEEGDAASSRRAAFMQQLVESATVCHSFTGMRNHRVLRAHFDYFNARGALENHTLWHGNATRTEGTKDARGRRALLTAFEAYALFHVVLWSGMSHFVSYNFGVSRDTANRAFRTMLRIVAYVGGKHQPYPSPDAMQKHCSAKARELLQLSESTIIFKGDATEWRIYRPTQIHSAVFSQYKHDHTGKLNAMVTCNGYVVEITRAYSGRTTDNQLHTAEAIGKRINTATGAYTPVLIYDKGLNRIQELCDNGVIFVRPTGKASSQLACHESDAGMNRIICSLRVTIENTFREMRTFKSFGQARRLSEIAEIDLIATAVRCLINLRPVRKTKDGVEETALPDPDGDEQETIDENF